jgi:RimJ/RimL family protein N-acetyltransferase
MVPVIETERLVLRGFERADFPAYAALWQAPEVVRFISKAPRPVGECWAIFLKIAGSSAMGGSASGRSCARLTARLAGG